jgi:UDP-N-acetylmuramoyl-tripeptide--D-alanyl-D-alanine ligase
MNKLYIGDVERISGGKLALKGDTFEVKGFSIDSRSIKPGDVFIAVKGHNFDGHDFIEEAFLKGASAVIAQRNSFSGENTGGKGLIIVDDTIESMAKIAGSLRKTAGIPVVCVTGTNGKTTVKDLLSSALSSRYNVLKSKASYNNVFGVSLTLFDIKSSHQAAVLEIGTSSPGEIEYLGGIAAPDRAVITNIGYGHLEALGDKNGVFREKMSLLEKLSDPGTAFLNGDDVMLSKVRKDARDIRFFGTGDNCDLRISGITRTSSGMEFFLNGEKFSVPGYGRHNV